MEKLIEKAIGFVVAVIFVGFIVFVVCVFAIGTAKVNLSDRVPVAPVELQPVELERGDSSAEDEIRRSKLPPSAQAEIRRMIESNRKIK